MRRLIISQSLSTCAEDQQHHDSLALWAALGSTGLSTQEMPLQSRLHENGPFVISLAKQYQTQEVDREVLLKAAHRTFIALLNQYAERPNQLSKVLTIALRNAMIDASQPREASAE